MFYLAILLHGFCFDFFFMTGQLYTDRKPRPIARHREGFSPVTYGVGMFIGSLLSGISLDFFSSKSADGTLTHNWQSFWLGSAGGAFVILALVRLLQTKAKIQNKAA